VTDDDLHADPPGSGDDEASVVMPMSATTKGTWVAAAVLLVAAGAGLLVDTAVAGPTPRERRNDMIAIAEAFTLALTSYDYSDLGASRDRVLDLAVRGFEQEFDRLLGASGVQQALTANQAVATATVTVGPLVADFGDHEARTFTVVDQIVTGAGTGPSTQRLRVEVLLVETPDGWVVTGAEVT